METAKHRLIAAITERKGAKTQEAFAAEVGIDQTHLSRLLSGERVPGRKTARRLVEKFPELRDVLAAVAASALLEVA